MPYDIHVIKSQKWFESDGGISLAEWQKLIEEDPDIEQTDKIETTVDGGGKLEFSLKNSLIAKWKNKDKIVWLTFRKGSITISHPDDEIIAKAKEIASKLGAKVQGDELEIY